VFEPDVYYRHGGEHLRRLRSVPIEGAIPRWCARIVFEMESMNAKKQAIEQGRATLGIELGSTRIKAVLIGEDHEPMATGGYEWENRLEDGVWTYRLDDVWEGLRVAYGRLTDGVKAIYGGPLKTVSLHRLA
jgi:hypothetical protein